MSIIDISFVNVFFYWNIILGNCGISLWKLGSLYFTVHKQWGGYWWDAGKTSKTNTKLCYDAQNLTWIDPWICTILICITKWSYFVPTEEFWLFYHPTPTIEVLCHWTVIFMNSDQKFFILANLNVNCIIIALNEIQHSRKAAFISDIKSFYLDNSVLIIS